MLLATRAQAEVRTGPRGRDGLRVWVIWAAGASCYVLALFHRMSLGVAAPEALHRFAAGPGALAVFSAVQLGTYLVLQVPSGVLADRWGPRRMLAIGMAAMAAGSGLLALSTTLPGGLAARVLVGMGDAVMFTNVLRLAAHWFTPRRYGMVAGLTGLAGGIGQLVATVPLTAALRSYGWSGTFAGAAVLTVLVGVLAVVIIRDGKSAKNAAQPVTVGAELVTDEDRAEPVRVALRAASRTRGTRLALCTHFTLMGQFVALTALWGVPWLTTSQGHSSAVAASLIMLCVLAFTASTLIVGQFAAGRPRRRELVVQVLGVAALLSWVLMVAWPGSLPLAAVIAVLVVIGVAGGASMLAFDIARSANPEHRSGTATGLVNIGGFTAAVLAQLGVGLALQLADGLGGAASYRIAFLPVVVILVVGVLGVTWVRRLSPRSPAS